MTRAIYRHIEGIPYLFIHDAILLEPIVGWGAVKDLKIQVREFESLITDNVIGIIQ